MPFLVRTMEADKGFYLWGVLPHIDISPRACGLDLVLMTSEPDIKEEFETKSQDGFPI